MKLLITGGAGQLGNELMYQLKAGGSALGKLPGALQNAEAVAVDLPDADLSKREEAIALVEKHRPDVVINCAAFTNVDRCETDTDIAFGANAVAPRNLAMACEAMGAKLVHVSTDYVFNGVGRRSKAEGAGEDELAPFTEAEPTGPQSAYGRTKLLGEQYVQQFCSRWFVVRTAWLYGKVGGNFVKTIVKAAKKHGALKVVNDQLGNPTSAEDVAHHLLKLAVGEQYGTYHCTCRGVCSWYDFAAEIVRLSGIDATVAPVTTEEYGQVDYRAAKRPAFSALDTTMLRATVGDDTRPWREAIAAYFAELPVEDMLA